MDNLRIISAASNETREFLIAAVGFVRISFATLLVAGLWYHTMSDTEIEQNPNGCSDNLQVLDG